MTGMINRRDTDRHHRRLRVRFWGGGESRAHSGFTANLSRTGAFIAAQRTFPRGSRIRVELNHDGGSLMLEGTVVHSYRVPPELRALGTSGMGVRFLLPVELLAPLCPAPQAGAAAANATATAGGTTSGAKGTAAEAPKIPVYPVHYDSAAKFLQSYHRDLVNGGIFVLTTRPSRLGGTVSIEFHLPPPLQRPVRAPGRVVQVMEPRSTPTGRAEGGMGVELTDLAKLLEDLRPAVEQLE